MSRFVPCASSLHVSLKRNIILEPLNDGIRTAPFTRTDQVEVFAFFCNGCRGGYARCTWRYCNFNSRRGDDDDDDHYVVQVLCEGIGRGSEGKKELMCDGMGRNEITISGGQVISSQ